VKTPPFLISAALLFWGGQTRLLPLAVLFAAALEARSLLKTRREVSRAEWSHLADICTIILLGILVVGFFRDKSRIIYDIGKLLPAVFFPIVLAQQYSLSGGADIAALSLIGRKQRKPPGGCRPKNILYPYFFTCLLSAGFGGSGGSGAYFAGICLLAGWAAYPIRSRRVPLLRWMLLLLLAGGAGFVFHTTLYHLQQAAVDFSSRFFEQDTDPFKTVTSIGDIGRQKLSDRILFRAAPEKLPPGTAALRLAEASYNIYRSRVWYALKSDLTPLEQPAGFRPVNLSPRPADTPVYAVEIQAGIKRRKATLKLPAGTFELDRLPDCTVLTNGLGSTVIQDVDPKLIRYRAAFAPGICIESPPTPLDLVVPDQEADAIAGIIRQLRLKERPPAEAALVLKDWFNTEFSYTLEHRGKGSRTTPLAFFLLDRKAGQCELFATATVLILRACGIPARYTIGYVAAEYSPIERQFIIRHRHGHAWARVFIDGRWQDLDTTSPNWLELEDAAQSPLHFLSDIFSFISFSAARLRWSQTDYLGRLVIGLLLLLIVLIANRVRRQKQSGRKKTARRKKKPRKVRRPAETDMDRLEKAIARTGWPRNPGEALLPWAGRVELAAPALLDYPLLRTVIHRHYRQRFAGGTAEPSSIRPHVEKLIRALPQ
jgi:transglutaminase-like putative cysteine protease